MTHLDCELQCKKEMEKFNDPKSDRIKNVKKKVDDVKEVMLENIDKVLARGEKLEVVLEKSDKLANQAVDFRRKSTDLKRQMCFNNIKVSIVLGVVLFLVIFFIVISICGFTFKSCRSSTPA